MTKERYIYIVMIAVLIFLNFHSCNNTDTFQQMYEMSLDSLQKSRNNLDQEVSKRKLLLGSVSDFKKIHAADSSAIGKLQKLVDKHTISATYLSNTTGNNISSAINEVIDHDTVYKDNIAYVYPEYRDTILNKWENFVMKANKDSFNLKYKVFNEFNLVQSWKRPKPFKRRIPEATVTNLNPHTETVEMAAFTLKEDKGNRIRDVIIGAAASAAIIGAVKVFSIKVPIRIRI